MTSVGTIAAAPSSSSPASHQLGSPAQQTMDMSAVLPPQSELHNDLDCGKRCCPSTLSCCLGLCPLAWICGITQVTFRQEAVVLNYGKYIGTLREPGCYCMNGCGTSIHWVSTSVCSTDLPALKVIDSRGNPLRVSGVVMWVVEDSKRAALEIRDYSNFLRSQAEVVMKQICSQHPYEARHPHEEDSLKTEAGKIRVDIVRLLQSKVHQAGIKVLDFSFNEISYAQEIASQMLVKQQAEAVVEARQITVNGAVGIAYDAIVQLRKKGIEVSQAEANRLASNLIITICSESHVQPTLSLGSVEERLAHV